MALMTMPSMDFRPPAGQAIVPGPVGPNPAPPASPSATAAVPLPMPDVATATALGSFSYTPNPDGSINQDPAWVKASIVTETVPILGDETCNRVMFAPLVGAMTDLASQGLAGLIDPSDLRDRGRNCYQPRYVDSDPSRGLSYHAWGIAIDLNRSQNPEGLPSHQDPRLVETLVRWGFRWGGIWSRPDPMHFELPNVLLPAARTAVTLTATAPPAVALGDPVTATADLAGGSQPTGVVVFKLYGPDDPTCKRPTVATSTATAGAKREVSSPIAVTATGTYQLVATYNGDAGNDPVSTPCGRVAVTATKVSTSLSAVTATASAPVGTPLKVAGNLAGSPIPPGGTMTFLLYGPDDPACQATPSEAGNQPVSGPGVYASGPLVPPEPGTYQWVVTYSGDGENGALSTPCGTAPVTVSP